MCALKKNINLIIKRQGHTTSLSSSFCASHFICVLFSSNIAPTHHTVAFFCPIKKESVLIRPHNLVITSKPDKKKQQKYSFKTLHHYTITSRERERESSPIDAHEENRHYNRPTPTPTKATSL